MNREIKFRAWNKEKEMLVDVLEIYFKEKRVRLPIESESSDEYWWYETDWDLDEVILMQFTGLKDENGVEIYEGDIVKLDIWQGQEDNYIDLVTHDVVTGRPSKHIKKIGELKKDIFGGLYIKDFYLLNLEIADKYEFEVIGTIYENPELLEVES